MSNNPKIKIDEATLAAIRTEAREIAKRAMDRRELSRDKQDERETNILYPHVRRPDSFERLANEQKQLEGDEESIYKRTYDKLWKEAIRREIDKRKK